MSTKEEKKEEMVEVRINAGVCSPRVVTADVTRSWYEDNKDICHLTTSQEEQEEKE